MYVRLSLMFSIHGQSDGVSLCSKLKLSQFLYRGRCVISVGCFKWRWDSHMSNKVCYRRQYGIVSCTVFSFSWEIFPVRLNILSRTLLILFCWPFKLFGFPCFWQSNSIWWNFAIGSPKWHPYWHLWLCTNLHQGHLLPRLHSKRYVTLLTLPHQLVPISIGGAFSLFYCWW